MSITHSSKKILIVEDELPLQSLLARHVKNAGHIVFTANNGVEALEIIKNKAPELMLLDIIMPLKNGYDVLQELRYNLNNQIAVIVVSNLKSQQDIDSARSFGISAYIVKSRTSLDVLSKTINQVIKTELNFQQTGNNKTDTQI